MAMRVVLLPGMDGTGALFSRFVAECPSAFETRIVAYPRNEPLGYDGLFLRVREELPRDGRWLLLGESFSGPLALRLAATGPPGLQGVILCASFVRAPGAARVAALLAPFVSRLEPPEWVLRRLLTGGDAHLAEEVRRALRDVAPDVIAERLRAIAAVDARDDLQRVSVPLLALSATEDVVLGARACARLEASAPSVSAVAIEAPHLLLQTAPGAAWAAIVAFTSRRAGDRPVS